MLAAKNPFVYGGIVSGDAFCDREDDSIYPNPQ